MRLLWSSFQPRTRFKPIPAKRLTKALGTGSANRMNEGAAAADHTFAMKAAQGGMAEVELGNSAKDHASNSAVKQFEQRMVDDHGKANGELKDLAAKENITLPTSLSAHYQAEKDRLSKLNGDAFDRAYMKMMVTDHRKDVAEFKREANSGKDADLKAWAGKTVPTLEEHLRWQRMPSGRFPVVPPRQQTSSSP